jgi:transposase-like protein
LSKKQYVYLWADGVYFNVRAEDSKHCILVLLGVRDDGVKELVGFCDGYRESEQSWTGLLEELKSRGLNTSPKLAIGDGALGFWKALSKVFPDTKQQRCWVHKMRNILDKLPHGLQGEAKKMLQNIWMAETKADALRAYSLFIKRFGDKYPQAVQCLTKDKEQLVAFYDFPATHWQHIRTTNPIESIFASVRLRTGKTRGMLSRNTLLALVFKIIQCSQKKWRKIRGFQRLAQVIQGVKFCDGLTQVEQNDLINIKHAA